MSKSRMRFLNRLSGSATCNYGGKKTKSSKVKFVSSFSKDRKKSKKYIFGHLRPITQLEKITLNKIKNNMLYLLSNNPSQIRFTQTKNKKNFFGKTYVVQMHISLP